MIGRRRAALLLATTALVAAGVVAGPSAAFAGTNGQQIDICNADSHGNLYQISGYNQDDQFVTYYQNAVENWTYIAPGQCNAFYSWYWVGPVAIYLNGNYNTYYLGNIPQSQGSDWVDFNLQQD